MVNFLVFIKVFLVCTDSNYHVDRIYPGSGDNLGQDLLDSSYHVTTTDSSARILHQSTR